jgi:hypothetical protein
VHCANLALSGLWLHVSLFVLMLLMRGGEPHLQALLLVFALLALVRHRGQCGFYLMADRLEGGISALQFPSVCLLPLLALFRDHGPCGLYLMADRLEGGISAVQFPSVCLLLLLVLLPHRGLWRCVICQYGTYLTADRLEGVTSAQQSPSVCLLPFLFLLATRLTLVGMMALRRSPTSCILLLGGHASAADSGVWRTTNILRLSGNSAGFMSGRETGLKPLLWPQSSTRVRRRPSWRRESGG